MNPLRVEERDNASEAILLDQESQEEPLGEAEMKSSIPWVQELWRRFSDR